VLEQLHAGRWSDELERVQGELLGYSPTQIKLWIEQHRSTRLGWQGRTL